MTTGFILSVCAFALLGIALIITFRDNRRLAESGRRLAERLKEYRKAAQEGKPLYCITRTIPEGKIAVEKMTFQNGCPLTMVIKEFNNKTDDGEDDEELNVFEAQELIAHLKE